MQEEFKDTKGVIRRRKSDDNSDKKDKTKRQTMFHKTLPRKLKIEQHERPLKISCDFRRSKRVKYSLPLLQSVV